MRLSKLVMDVCRGSRLLLGRYVSEATPRPYNQLRVLQVVNEGICSQILVAERLFLDPPAVSRLVDKLEGDGLLSRAEGADRRCVKLDVTAAAAAELERLEGCQDRLDEVVCRYLDETERTDLRRLLAKLGDGLRLEG